MIAISIEEEHRNQTHKMPIEHQPRANLIVGKQRVNKIDSNSKAINKGKTPKIRNQKQTNHAGTVGRLDTGPSFVLIKRPRLGKQLSTWLWEAITGKTVSMGNSSTAEVLGIGSVDLKFPSGRILSLKRVHHVPTVRRNIISGSVIVREGYELAFKFNKVVIQQFETQTGKKLKRLRSDRGGEYESSKFTEYCQTFGIIHEETPPYSPSSNGVAERKNRTFKDMINSLLLTSGLPKYLWGEALNTACHILNRVPLKHNTSTPFELWK
ncbi:UNVERIFIED_CONTAM: Retrovirus-related Pol polyprotein from transposon TNT 1-94, partial [Sesamum calycinum]